MVHRDPIVGDSSSAAAAELDVQRRDEFFAMAVHELRGPATVILGCADTLETIWDREDRTQGRELLTTLVRQSRHLKTLIGDLLTAAAIDHQSLHIAMALLPVRPILRWAVDASTNDRSFVEVDCRGDLHAFVDADRLEQIVSNLVTNALAYGQPPIDVHASVEGGRVRIAVGDRGSGIAAADVPHLFERFSALSASTRHSNGLGLAISRDLARAMGGDLVYENACPGSRFVVVLSAVEVSVVAHGRPFDLPAFELL